MPTSYRLTLFGGFALNRPDGTAVALATRKTRLLLAYLALTPGRAHPRETLATLLWGEHGEAQARGSLRQTLVALRRCFAVDDTAPLAADRDTVMLAPGALDVDALRFDRLSEGGPAELAQAASLSVGPLLEGLASGSAAFEEWLRGERDIRRTRLATVLRRLLAAQEAVDAGEGLATADRLLALDPLDEAAHRAAMRLHAGRGEWGLALQRFEACRTLLQAELGVAPEAETLGLHERLLRRESPAIVAPAALAPAPEGPLSGTMPSLAVMPFAELGGDPSELYFADGITADVVTELSRFRSLSVIAAGSSFAYRGAGDLPRIGRELGVRYVLEGSVRRAGGRIRIAVRLVEAATRRHVWAERYDRPQGDVFDLQDEVARRIVTAVSLRVADADLAATRRKPPRDLRAYELFLRGNAHSDVTNPAAQAEALSYFEQARAADPNYARAYNGIAIVHATAPFAVEMGCPPSAAWDRALAAAEAALVRDPEDARVRNTLAWVHLLRREFEASRRESELALRLNPNDPIVLIHVAWNRASCGEPEGALELAEAALRLNPLHPEWYGWNLGRIHCLGRRLALAARYLDALHEPQPRYLAWRAANRAHRGQRAEAAEAADAFCAAARARWRGDPRAGPADYVAWLLAVTPLRRSEDADYLVEGLHRAGLPTQSPARTVDPPPPPAGAAAG